MCRRDCLAGLARFLEVDTAQPRSNPKQWQSSWRNTGWGVTDVPKVENDSPETYAWELVWPLWFTTSKSETLGLPRPCKGPISIPRPGMEARAQVGTKVAFASNKWHPNPLSLSGSCFHSVSFTSHTSWLPDG